MSAPSLPSAKLGESFKMRHWSSVETLSSLSRLPAPERRILRPAEGEALVGRVERALDDRGRGREVRVDNQ